MDIYTKLLSTISGAVKEFPPRLSSGYNIFNILDITEKEVIMCRFLADLLNPEGRHGCGTLFLRSFSGIS